MEITVLCKIVDNFGDIGVAWRMVRQLKNKYEYLNIHLIVDDLTSFSKIDNQINPACDFQKINDINIYNWNAEKFCSKEFSCNDGEKLAVILELFQCGRPDWLEKILFEDKLHRTVQIIMIDYLTAEAYAEDFHKLLSLTRSGKVKKINFMPGFTNKTGGLIIDDSWQLVPPYNETGSILFFCYDRNWSFLKNAAAEVFGENKKILVAQGKGHDTFMKSQCGKNLCIEELPFLNQEDWDEMMKKCSILFIRGEESMSRACLSGIPFIWHAYPQSDEYQLVKVKALLEKMQKYFKSEDFKIIEDLTLAINQSDLSYNQDKLQKLCESFLKNSRNLVYGFYNFAVDLRKNGDLITNLMTFIEEICIIKN